MPCVNVSAHYERKHTHTHNPHTFKSSHTNEEKKSEGMEKHKKIEIKIQNVSVSSNISS